MSEISGKMEKLSAKNYATWKIMMSSLLASKGLTTYCDKNTPVSEENFEKHEQAKFLMYSTMDPQQIMATGVCESAAALWAKIKENHEGAEIDLRNNILADFLGFKYRKDESIVQYCGRFEMLLGRLEATGHKVDEGTKLWVFRNTLPKEIKATVNMWTLAHTSTVKDPKETKVEVKINELISQLKVQYHMDRHDKQEDSIALYSGENKKIQDKSFKKDESKQPQTEKICNYCKMKGHWWRDCKKKKTDDQRKKKYASKPTNNKPHRSGAFVADEVERYHSFSPGSQYWIVDSGATSHMTAHKSFMQAYEEFEEPRIIRLGDGKPTQALGQGKVPFISDGFEGELHSVLWVPELRENLFSVSRAMAQGCDVKFTHNPTVVSFLKENSVKLKGYRTKLGLFVLHLKPLKTKKSSRVETLAAVTAEEWHQRYAHGSINSIKELAKKGAVKGLVFKENSTDKCADCAQGKICRVSHPSRTHVTASDKVAVLHLDTCGPIAETSLGGHRFFVLATEEYSDYKIVGFVQSKAEIPTLVRKMITQVTLESKRPVKLIVTDNGTEYCNRSLSNWLNENTILHRTTAAYTPQQNGRAERANRTIIEGVRTLLSSTKLPTSLWAEAANTVVYTNNRLLSPRNSAKTRYELYFKRVPDVSNLRVFGQRAVVRIPDNARDGKLSRKGEHCTFIGYTDRWNTYRFLADNSTYVFVSCDVIFLNENTQEVCPRIQEHASSQQEMTISFGRAEKPQEPQHNHTADDKSSSMEGYLTDTDTQMDEDDVPAQENFENVQANDDMRSIEDNSSSSRDSGNQRSVNSNIVNMESDPDNSGDAMINMSSSTQLSNPATEESIQILSSTNASTTSTDSTVTAPKRTTRATSGGVSNLVKPRDVGSWFWGVGDSRRNSSRRTPNESALFTLDDEPLTVKDAQESKDWNKWKKAMDEELDALNKNKTWVLVDKPDKIKCVKNKWVFKVKLNPQGDIERYKARLVAKGYSQIPNIDYKETYAPVAGMNTIRLIFSIANQMNMEILQFDIKTAFLYGDLHERIYMEYPEGYPNPNNKVCKLIKSLYGLKQAPRQWNIKFDSFLQRFNLEQSIVDKCLYFNNQKSLLLVIYVDDGLVVSKDKKLLDSLIEYLKKNFELKVMECESYLGFQVLRDKNRKWLKLQQAHYADKILEKFEMLDCKPASTPEEVGAVNLADAPKLPANAPFKELVGSLLYLVTCTRPDIAHAVSVASRTSEPTEAHWKALKRILRYIKGTKDIGIHFRWEKFPQLIGYSDADYANDVETRRSTTGYCIMFGGGPVAWRCQRQSIVTLSTTEAEYVSGCELVKELLPTRELLIELEQIKDEPTPVLIDNQSAVRISKNDGGQQRTKHIDVRDKWLNEQVDKKKIDVKHIFAEEQAADILTKPLHKTKFISNRNLILSTVALLALTTIVGGEYFPRTNPLFFRPSNMPYFTGDIRVKLTLEVMNPCRTFFTDIDKPSKLPSLVHLLIKDCHDSFSKKVAGVLDSCTGPPIKDNVTDIFMNTGSISTRVKRHPALIIAAGFFFAVLTGVSAGSLAISYDNSKRIDNMNATQKRTQELLEESMNIYQHVRDSVDEIHHWGQDIASRVDRVEADAELRYKVAGLITRYEEMFSEQRNLLLSLNEALKKGKVNPGLATSTNITLWDEPAAEWSSVKACSFDKDLPGKALMVELLFNVPKLDKQIKIMEAMPLNFYNASEKDNKKTLCYYKYKGPKHFILNETATCMTEVLESMAQDNAVRSQTCRGPDDEFKPKSDDLFEIETCQNTAPMNKRRIQDKEYHGLHRIYCYPFNITVGEHETPCPDYPFELGGETTYKIANIEHSGSSIEAGAQLKTKTLQLNHAIIAHLKLDKTSIRTLNSTNLTSSIDSYYEKLKKLQITADYKPMDWFQTAATSVKSLWEKASSFFESIGIALGVVAGCLLLIILAPALEILFLGFGIFKFITRFYMSVVRNIIRKVRRISPKKRDDMFKLI